MLEDTKGAFDSNIHWWDSAECFGSSIEMQQYIDQKRISLLPSNRHFNENSFFNYSNCFNKPLIKKQQLDIDTLVEFINENRIKLEKYPIYIAIDKDVLNENYNIQTWKEGVLTLEQLLTTLNTIINASKNNIIGASICGEHGAANYQSSFHSGNILEFATKLLYQKNKYSDLCHEQNYTTNTKLIEVLQGKETNH